MLPTIVILAAGIGSRLGRPEPKPLTRLADGRTILQQQLDNIRAVVGEDASVVIVVGFKLGLLVEAAPDASFVYNEAFDRTNTARSLSKALRVAAPGDVVWMNGDVVFDPRVLERVVAALKAGESSVAVNTASVGEEEVKYRVDSNGDICELSKEVVGGAGEAVGINCVAAQDLSALRAALALAGPNDYFERGIELAIEQGTIRVRPLDVSDLLAMEIDFEDDLRAVNAKLGGV